MIHQSERKLDSLIYFLQVYFYLIIVNDIEDSQNLQIKIGNEFFDLSSLIVLNKEISVNAAAPLTIVKKGAVIAKGKFNYQNGVQWITFNYEGKKQNGNFALSLIDCIKIKVKCVNGIAGSTNSSKRQIKAKTSIRKKMLGIKSPIQKGEKIKQSHNRSYEEEVDFCNYFKEIGGELTTTNKNSKILTSSVILNRNIHTPVNKVKNAKFTSISYVNHNKNNPSISSMKNKRDKTPLITNNENKTKQTTKKLKSYNAHTNERKLKQNDNNKTFEGKEIIRKLEPNFTKTKMNETVSNIKKKEIISDSNISIHEDTKKTKQTASIASPTTIDNESNSILHSSISQELIKLTFPESNNLLDDDMNNLGDTDTFGQIKNDFNLLYTDEYITMIPDDLLKLELELLIEKMFEIVNCYHTQMSNEKIIYNKVNDLYKVHINFFY